MTHATPLAAGMPASMHLIGPAYTVFAEASVHIRAGMIFHPDRPVELFQNGNASFFLVQGNPGQAALDMAKQSQDHALQQQAARYDADVKRAAQALVEQEKRDALDKQMAEVVAAHEKAVEKLKREAEAELAKFNKK